MSLARKPIEIVYPDGKKLIIRYNPDRDVVSATDFAAVLCGAQSRGESFITIFYENLDTPLSNGEYKFFVSEKASFDRGLDAKTASYALSQFAKQAKPFNLYVLYGNEFKKRWIKETEGTISFSKVDLLPSRSQTQQTYAQFFREEKQTSKRTVDRLDILAKAAFGYSG